MFNIDIIMIILELQGLSLFCNYKQNGSLTCQQFVPCNHKKL